MTDIELYNKYPHIVKGSIELVPKGQEIICGKDIKIISHGKIAVIKCSNHDAPYCLKTRVINIQDIKQTTLCTACTRRLRNKRRRNSRKLVKALK